MSGSGSRLSSPVRQAFGRGDRVVVTGGAGFVGSAIVRALAGHGVHPSVLVEPGADRANLDGLDVEEIIADVRDAPSVRAAVAGARFVFHAAALYRFWAPDPRVFDEVNVGGTRNVLDAARSCGVERLVYTSTVGTLGLDPARRHAATEDDHADVAHLFGHYKRTKYVAEHEVLRAAAAGLPVVLVQPTLPVGPFDRAPTPSGRIVLDFLNGRMPAFVGTTLNIVDVDDVAAGHLLAAAGGAQGRSYILGGDDLPMRGVLDILGSLTGLPAPKLRAPRAAVLAAGHLSELVEGRLLRRRPTVPLEAARMATTHMAFDDRRARAELGYRSRSATEALARACRWYVDHGYVRPARAARIAWNDAIARTDPGHATPEPVGSPAGAMEAARR